MSRESHGVSKVRYVKNNIILYCYFLHRDEHNFRGSDF